MLWRYQALRFQILGKERDKESVLLSAVRPCVVAMRRGGGVRVVVARGSSPHSHSPKDTSPPSLITGGPGRRPVTGQHSGERSHVERHIALVTYTIHRVSDIWR